MIESIKRFAPLESLTEGSAWSDATGCYLGKLFFFHQWRNAWWGFESSLYPDTEAFHLLFNVVRDRVEKRRTQGTVWRLRELPVAVITSKAEAVIIVEINTQTPFQAFANVPLRGRTTAELADCFRPKKANSIFRFVAESSATNPAMLPFRRYVSQPHGPKDRFYLTWVPEREEMQLEYVCLTVKRINQHLQTVLVA